MPATLTVLDDAYNSYKSMLLMDYIHSHPIVVVLCHSLWEDIKRKKAMQKSTVDTEALHDGPQHRPRVSRKLRWQRIRAKCWLAVTLYHNPQLRAMRSHQLKQQHDRPVSVWL